MSLAAGTKLGPYEILSAIGAGGMGEVYRARDTKLNRDVALKILPDAFASDPDRLARFTREAQTLAALNHPNIAHIHGLEESGGLRALVMELVEGEDLAQRLVRGPILLDEALPIAKQIAEALEAAHEQGIIHRDLKPANIKVRDDGTVKVLDFGLAKALAGDTAGTGPGAAALTNSPTLTSPAMMTGVGVLLGTAAYMAPEQAKGRPADKRSDVWAFGCVLYEMLTGKRAFEGEDVSDTLATVLKSDPNWRALPADTPPSIRRLLQRCLAKDRKARIPDIALARFEIEEVLSGSVPSGVGPAPSRLGIAASIAATVFAVVAAGVSFIHFREKPAAADLVRFQIPLPGKNTFGNSSWSPIALSPDGRRLAFVARSEGGVDQLWVRALDNLQARPLPGTEGAVGPFWSPDSRFLAFQVQGKLKKVEASGGPPQTMCDIPPAIGGAWSPDGVIIGAGRTGLVRCEARGTTFQLTTLDSSREVSHGSPSFLPDGRHFVYLRRSRLSSNIGIYLGSLDAKPEQQPSKPLVTTTIDVRASLDVVYAPSPDVGASNSGMGYLLFLREGTIMAQAFENRRLELAGDATPIVGGLPDVAVSFFSASATGVLAYQAAAARRAFQATWLDREGKVAGTAADAPDYANFWNFSHDGTRLAGVVAVLPPEIWLYDFARGNSTRFTTDANDNGSPVWSPDGRHIVFASVRDGVSNVVQKDSSGAGNEEIIFKSSERLFLYDWSRNGLLLYGAGFPKDSLWYLSFSDRKSTRYLKRDSQLHQARFSPDGNCVAYASNESGRQEVYVQPFPAASESKWQVSKGGIQPRWRGDGKELFYTSPDSSMMAVAVTTTAGKCGPASQAGIPTALFATPSFGTLSRSHQYDVRADGKQFLIRDQTAERAGADTSPITVVLNWQAGLKK